MCSYMLNESSFLKDAGNILVWRNILFRATFFADAFDHIFRFFLHEAFGQWHWRNLYVRHAEGAVANAARQVDMSLAVARVIEVANAILLRAATVINLVEQVCLGED